MEKLSNNLLLLIANLAQQKNKRSIIKLFIQGLNSLLPHIFFSWGDEPGDKTNSIEVSTQKKIYGEINYSGGSLDNEPFILAKIQNAAQMLALILERLEQEQLLNDEKSHLEQQVNKRTIELKKQVEEYESLSGEYKDLSDRLKESLDKTEKSEEKLRSILENSSNVFYRHDINHKNTYLSPRIKQILGYEPEEAKVNWTELTSDNPMNKIGYELTMKAIETGKQQEPYVLELLHKSGKKVIVEVRETPLVKNGKTEAIVGALVDITDIKLNEQKIKLQNAELEKNIKQLKQTTNDLEKAKNKAEESDRLKSAFIKNMSHEIRTPINGIIGFIDLMQNKGISGERRSHYLKLIKKSSDRLLYTINDIIEISKIEAGQMTINYTNEYLNEILWNIYEIFVPEAKTKGLSLKLSSELDDNAAIKTDRIKLESILANLLKNALKFSSKGEIEFGCQQKENMLEFYVADNGGGIPEDRLHAIFDRFVKADMGISCSSEGSGLGLSIAKEYVEMFGGKIWAETELEKGSIFYFTVRYNPVKLKKSETKKEYYNIKALSSHKKNILIAEDDNASIKLLDLLLSSDDFELVHARNGKEAVEICKKNSKIDLVLMDLRMPVMDGLEATKQIRKFCKDIPIIAQTAYALSGDREKSLRAGCSDYLSKPIRKEELLRKIQAYLNKSN